MKISVMRAFVLLGLAACNAKVSTPLPETLRVQVPSEPTHLNPYLAETGAEMTILRNLVRTPLRFDHDGAWKAVGDAAESYAWSIDGKELKLVFRSDLRWSDGAPLTACQYRAGILRMLGKNTGFPSPMSELYRALPGYKQAITGNFSEIERNLRCNDRELVLTSTAPHDRDLVNALCFVGSAPWRDGLDPEQKVSSGLFRSLEWKKGRSIKITAVDPQHFLVPTFEFLFIRDPDTALIMYEKGDLDVLTELPALLIPQLRSREDFRKASMMATYYVAFATKNAAWTREPRLRRALALSAGREEIPSLLQGGERAAYTLTPDDLIPASQLAAFRDARREDPKEAKRLWDEVAAQNPKLIPDKISLGYPAGSRHQLLMERLANNWQRRLGVEVSFDPQEWNHYIDVLKKKAPALFRYAWTAVYPDPRFFLGIFQSSSLNNFGGWSSPAFDKKITSLDRAKIDDENFIPEVLEAEDLLVWKEAALIPLYHYAKVFMARGEVGRKLKFTYNGFLDITSLIKQE